MADDPKENRVKWLCCGWCSEELFEADENGLFWETTTATCKECDAVCEIRLDESYDCDCEDWDGCFHGTVWVDTIKDGKPEPETKDAVL